MIFYQIYFSYFFLLYLFIYPHVVRCAKTAKYDHSNYYHFDIDTMRAIVHFPYHLTFLKGVSHATGKNKMAFNTTMYFGTYDVACNSRQHSRQNLNVKIIIFMIIQVNSINARNNVSLRDSSIL